MNETKTVTCDHCGTQRIFHMAHQGHIFCDDACRNFFEVAHKSAGKASPAKDELQIEFALGNE